MIDILIHDIRYALRLIRKAPGFSAVAILSLATGIGASTVLFSLANAFLFRPVQAANSEQVMTVFTSNSSGPPHLYGGSSYADYEDYRKVPVFDGLLAWMRIQSTLSDSDRADVIDGLLVSGNYFDVLGLGPSAGRFFRPEETQTPGSHPVVVLSHDAWRRRFNADPAIVGRVIELGGHAFSVIGVGPVRYVGTSIEHVADFFAPAMMQAALAPGFEGLRDRRQRSFHLLGRLKPGVSQGQADAALRVVAADLLRQDPVAWRDRTGRGRIVTVLPELEGRFAGAPTGTVAIIFSSVMAGVVALLAIACINVATVLLARATTRRKEIAVRLALGASRRRMIRQLLTECALLAVAGGTLGLVIAQMAAAAFLRFRPDGVPALDLTLDSRILIFSIAASTLAVLLFGLAPALQTTRPDVNAELKGLSRVVRARGLRFNLRSGLVVVQVAVSLALLIGAGLMLRSAHAGRTEDPGFRRDQIVNIGIDLNTIPDRDGAHLRIYRDAARAVATLPGVERVALAALLPMDGSNSQVEMRLGSGPSATSVSPDINVIGAGYFALLDVPMRQGREFTDGDLATSPRVAVVNEAMARQYWNGDAIGKTFTEVHSGDLVQIVGIVRDQRHRSFNEDPRPMTYFSAAQVARERMALHIRTAVPAGVIAPALQRALHEVERTAGLTQPETMTAFFARMMLPQSLAAGGATAVAFAEMTLGVMALYGVIAFAASQRRREIGLRMALGASDRSVLALVMREGLLLTSIGAVIGVGIALLGGVALQSELIGVGPADPVSFGGAVLVILIVGAAASYMPARRALKVDPSAALRSE